MGLTIHYELLVSGNLKVAVVRELVQRVAEYAKTIGCAEVGQVQSAAGDDKNAGLFVQVGRPEDCCFGTVPPKRGRLVEVWPGEGCESATFGLCQYPRRTPFRAGSVPTVFEGGLPAQEPLQDAVCGRAGLEAFPQMPQANHQPAGFLARPGRASRGER